MKDQIIKNFHWIIILYTIFGLYTIYEEKSELLTQAESLPPTVEIKIERAKNKIKKIERFKQNLTKSKERVEEVVRQIEKVQKQLPSNVNDTEVQTLIGDIASKLKMRDPQPAPADEVNNGFYFAKDYNFTGQGTFLQFLIFFENLEKAERILNIKNLSMKLDPNEAKSRFPILTLETTIESYRYNSAYKEKSGVEEIENAYGDQ